MEQTDSNTEWLEQRRKGIGGSDVAAVFNLPPYHCARRLWYDKTGVQPDYPEEITPPMERGTRLEAIAAELYSETTGRRLRRMGARVHRTVDHLRVNVDRTILTGSSRWAFLDTKPPRSPSNGGRELPMDSAGNLEIKVPGQYMFAKMKREGIPDYIQLQIQHGFLVTGRKWGAFAAFWADGWEMIEFDVFPDAEIIETIKERSEMFWVVVENGPAPAPLPPEDSRCQRCPWRKTCQGDAMWALSKPQQAKENERPEIEGQIRALITAQELEKDAKDLVTTAKEDLKDVLGDDTEARAGGHRVTYRAHPVQRVNSKRLKKDLPKVWQKYAEESWQRPLRVYGV